MENKIIFFNETENILDQMIYIDKRLPRKHSPTFVGIMIEVAMWQSENNPVSKAKLLEIRNGDKEEIEDFDKSLKFQLENNIIELKDGLYYEGVNFHKVLEI